MRLPPLLQKLWPPEAPPALPHLARPLAVIADLHGRADLLTALLARLAARDPDSAARIVFLGDLIDRGPDSAAVLTAVQALCLSDPDRIQCLMGNHERLMLDFLADPAAQGPRWWAAGGDSTLAAFGIHPAHGREPDARWQSMADALRAALPAGLQDWLAALPLLWREGDLVLSHAGLDPALTLEVQTESALLWGHHQGKYRGLRADGLWSVQGHQIVKDVRIEPGRIRIDLGAWRSGRLAALWLDGANAEVIEA